MAIHKVQKGEQLVFHVTAVQRDVPATNPKYKPSHKFVGTTGDDTDAAVFMMPESAVRQLARHGLTLDTVVGHTIVFAKPGEYLDIELPTGTQYAAAPVATAAPAGATAAAPAPLTNEERLTKLFALYDRCFDQAARSSKRLKSIDAEVTHEGVGSMTATMFIAAMERGITI